MWRVRRATLRLMPWVLTGGLAITLVPSLAQDAIDASEKEIERYRQMLKADPWSNPAMLDVDRGEALWKTPRGPRPSHSKGAISVKVPAS